MSRPRFFSETPSLPHALATRFGAWCNLQRSIHGDDFVSAMPRDIYVALHMAEVLDVMGVSFTTPIDDCIGALCGSKSYAVAVLDWRRDYQAALAWGRGHPAAPRLPWARGMPV